MNDVKDRTTTKEHIKEELFNKLYLGYIADLADNPNPGPEQYEKMFNRLTEIHKSYSLSYSSN